MAVLINNKDRNKESTRAFMHAGSKRLLMSRNSVFCATIVIKRAIYIVFSMTIN